jgi:glutathione S-transferase
MEPILVYGHPAGSSMGLVAALEWLGQPYRLCRVDMLGEMRELSFARINARHETPVLIAPDGRAVTETMAIAAWFAARDDHYRISFAPRSAEADRMWQMIGYINTGFTGAFSPLWTALEMDNPDPGTVETLKKIGNDGVIERHDKLEAMIGDTDYLVGDHPSLADGVLIGVARWLDYHQVASAERWPKLAALRRRLEEHPAVTFATAIENGENRAGSGACLGHVALSDIIARHGRETA